MVAAPAASRPADSAGGDAPEFLDSKVVGGFTIVFTYTNYNSLLPDVKRNLFKPVKDNPGTGRGFARFPAIGGALGDADAGGEDLVSKAEFLAESFDLFGGHSIL